MWHAQAQGQVLENSLLREMAARGPAKGALLSLCQTISDWLWFGFTLTL